jgi:hypothetical protein
MKRTRTANIFRQLETFFRQFSYAQNRKNSLDEVLRKVT